MIDLYIIWTPVICVLIIGTLLSLKSVLSEPKINQLSYYLKIKTKQSSDVQNPPFQSPILEENSYKKTFYYLLKNFTLLQFCITGRGRNKIPLLLSLSLIALSSLILQISFVFSILGSLVTLSFFLIKSLTQQTEDQRIQKQLRNKEKEKQSSNFQTCGQIKLQIGMCLISLMVNILILGFVYKNFYNNLLMEAAINTLISVCLDNFLVKPIILAITAFPLKNLGVVNIFIDKENTIIEVLQGKRAIQKIFDRNVFCRQKSNSSSFKKQNLNTIEIEPRLDLANKQNYLSTIQLTKNMRKTKLSPLCLKKKAPVEQGESSLISILNSNEKKKKDRNLSFDLQKSMHEEKVEEHLEDEKVLKNRSNLSQEDYENSVICGSRKKNKLYSSKMVVVEPDTTIINGLNNEIQNQEEEDFEASVKVKDRQEAEKQNSLKESGFRHSSNNDPLRISHHGLGDNGVKEETEQEQYCNHPRPHTTFEENNSIFSHNGIHTSRKNGLLKINQDRNAQDLQQIDLNSPERRYKNLNKIAEQSHEKCKIKKKKAYKKYSLDPNRHVIRHSTGEPYLEFLPNLLNKEREEKVLFDQLKKRKSQVLQQQFSRKMDLFQSNLNQNRLIKSVKGAKSRGPIVKENDENQIPQFVIQDFE